MEKYAATLGHKANHSFVANAEWALVEVRLNLRTGHTSSIQKLQILLPGCTENKFELMIIVGFELF